MFASIEGWWVGENFGGKQKKGSLRDCVGGWNKETTFDRLDGRRGVVCKKGSGRFGRGAMPYGKLSSGVRVPWS